MSMVFRMHHQDILASRSDTPFDPLRNAYYIRRNGLHIGWEDALAFFMTLLPFLKMGGRDALKQLEESYLLVATALGIP